MSLVSDPPDSVLEGITSASVLIIAAAENQGVLEHALESLELEVARAVSGENAVACLRQHDFAFVTLDLSAPGLDAAATADLIRQTPRAAFTPIVFVGAPDRLAELMARGLALGAVDYFPLTLGEEAVRAKASALVELFRRGGQPPNRPAGGSSAETGRSGQQLAFLAEASKTLAASLDGEETYFNLCRLLVPGLAEGCVLDVLEADGSLRTVAIRHKDPRQEALLTDLRARYPIDAESGRGAAIVLRTGKAEVCTHVDGEALSRISRDDDHRRMLEQLDLHCYIAAPLNARGRTLGILSLLNIGEARECGPAEVRLTEELAQRSALALDNAALHKSAQAARREAERANAAKDRFLAMLSHELRTPLTPVLTSLHLLEGTDALPESAQASLQMIRRNVELEARLIDDLLDVTHIAKGRVSLNLGEVDAHALLRHALEICESGIRDKRLEVYLNLAAREHGLRADPARIQQIYWNLLKNAVKFTLPGGWIAVTTSNDAAGRLRVEIADNGLGIDPAALPNLFNAFGVGETDHSCAGGLRLGLAIARALAEVHQGTIFAESSGQNQGAKFTVLLPTMKNREGEPSANLSPAPASVRDPRSAAPTAPLRVLLVDDHEDTNRSLSLLLRRRGYEVRTATSFAAALAAAREQPIDVLVSDMGLPDGNGADLLRQLDQPPVYGGIILSGYGMEEDIQRSHDSGYDEHLNKPVDVGKLDATIRKLVARPRS